MAEMNVTLKIQEDLVQEVVSSLEVILEFDYWMLGERLRRGVILDNVINGSRETYSEVIEELLREELIQKSKPKCTAESDVRIKNEPWLKTLRRLRSEATLKKGPLSKRKRKILFFAKLKAISLIRTTLEDSDTYEVLEIDL